MHLGQLCNQLLCNQLQGVASRWPWGGGRGGGGNSAVYLYFSKIVSDSRFFHFVAPPPPPLPVINGLFWGISHVLEFKIKKGPLFASMFAVWEKVSIYRKMVPFVSFESSRIISTVWKSVFSFRKKGSLSSPQMSAFLKIRVIFF